MTKSLDSPDQYLSDLWTTWSPFLKIWETFGSKWDMRCRYNRRDFVKELCPAAARKGTISCNTYRYNFQFPVLSDLRNRHTISTISRYCSQSLAFLESLSDSLVSSIMPDIWWRAGDAPALDIGEVPDISSSYKLSNSFMSATRPVACISLRSEFDNYMLAISELLAMSGPLAVIALNSSVSLQASTDFSATRTSVTKYCVGVSSSGSWVPKVASSCRTGTISVDWGGAWGVCVESDPYGKDMLSATDVIIVWSAATRRCPRTALEYACQSACASQY